MNYNKKYYLEFIYLEIPNIIQIIGLLSFFNYLSNNLFLNLISGYFIVHLLGKYIETKINIFFRELILNSESKLYKDKLDINILIRYSSYTLLILYTAVFLISLSIYYL